MGLKIPQTPAQRPSQPRNHRSHLPEPQLATTLGLCFPLKMGH